ncbi:MAG TPA: S8 family serine peptidase [Longimicrobiaceae bacterium]|nr:S8 family serine peptidase [Longimicrobiaceae bacterium]
MRRTVPFTAALLVAAVAGCRETPMQAPAAAGGPLASASAGAPIYLVTFRDGVDVSSAADALGRGHGFSVRHVRLAAARGFSAAMPAAVAERLAQDPRVLLVEKDGPVHLIYPVEQSGPGASARPGGGGGAGQTTPWGITRVGGAGDGTGKTAWILDTGVDIGNPDLNTSRACHTYFAGNSPSDGNGHGTHVAGTIAAINNGIDVVGVAANAYVCSVRVLGNSGSGSWEGVINGINYVASHGASGDVANMSLGGSGTNATLENAVSSAAQKGIKFVIAAGNSGVNAGTETPGRVNGSNIYTVSAVDSKDCMPSWSNWGNPPVDFAAPGVSIVSLKRGGGTTTMSGTSMAAPHVAGVLLLGSARTNGRACNDPDGNPDPIVSR